VLQLVNTPDIYEENKYQRRNLLLYHSLLESGLRKFNVSQHYYIYDIYGSCAVRQLEKVSRAVCGPSWSTSAQP
jgi:hypothetical protein